MKLFCQSEWWSGEAAQYPVLTAERWYSVEASLERGLYLAICHDIDFQITAFHLEHVAHRERRERGNEEGEE
jgi:hypothetical protein